MHKFVRVGVVGVWCGVGWLCGRVGAFTCALKLTNWQTLFNNIQRRAQDDDDDDDEVSAVWYLRACVYVRARIRAYVGAVVPLSFGVLNVRCSLKLIYI